MEKKKLNVGIIGHRFMGKAHSNAWLKAPLFFDLDAQPILKTACARSEDELSVFAKTWGWESTETDWRKVVEDPEIDIVDISTPTHLHFDMAIAAAENGKHVFCEKPLALSKAQSEEMLRIAESNKVVHYVNHNYRRTPAVMLAKKMIDEGQLGQIYHWRGCYQQDWIVDPEFPLTWQLQKEYAMAGPHWDLNSHSVDLALFLVGPIKEVSCMTSQFIKERPLPGVGAKAFTSGSQASAEKGKVTVEDASLMMVRFTNGAVGSFEATRFATGRKNHNTFEIYGSKGSIRFDLERMNELEYFNREDPAELQGFRTIMVTESTHPYLSHWWPPGHIIGYEHAFVHAVADFITAVSKGSSIHPNFEDGVKIMSVLEAALQAAESGSRTSVK